MKLTYGIPLWLMKKYLADLGATEVEENVMQTDDWTAKVAKGEPHRLGSLVVGRIDVELSGDPDVLDNLVEKLHWKTMRGGG
ncbi:MAG: DUF1952 domain-containing protein [Chloroflexi bacterium]|nr:MAG: DUF1952 domain-containing protein [Chloroflexota bacterium]